MPSRKLTSVFVEFDKQQLTVTSDVPEATEYFRKNYSRMIVAEVSDGIGELRVCRSENGYRVSGSVDREYPAGSGSLYDHLRREVLLLFVRARSDLLWLHSGAVERDGRAVLISGASARGKSTLVTQLYRRGWKLLSDEAAPIMMEKMEVVPFPQRPRRRLYPGRHVAAVDFDSFKLEEVYVGSEEVRREPTEIKTMIFPSFRIGVTPELKRMPPGDAAIEIIRNLMNFVDHKSNAVAHAALMASRLPCYRLTYSDGSDAAAVIDAEVSSLEVV